jgi:hypothetical protein
MSFVEMQIQSKRCFLETMVSKRNKEKIMAENIVSEATWNWTRSLNDTNRAFTDSAVAAQERNLRYGQSVFENGLEVLKSHTQRTRALTEKLVEQTQKEQEAFQGLTHDAIEVYVGFISSTFGYYRQLFDSVGSLSWHGVDIAQKVMREGMDATQATLRQGEKAAR